MLRCDFIPHGLDKNQPGNWPSAQFLSSWFLQWGYPHSLLRRNLSTCQTVSEFKGGKQPRPFLWALYYCRKLKAQTILATLICAHTWICIKFIVSENKHGKPTEASFLFSFLLFMCLWVAKEHSYYVKKKKKEYQHSLLLERAYYKSCKLLGAERQNNWKLQECLLAPSFKAKFSTLRHSDGLHCII